MDDEKEDVMQSLHTFGAGGSYKTLAPEPPGPQPQNWGIVQGGNSWSGVGNIPDGGMLPSVVVSNSTQATTYSAEELLAK